MLSDRERKALRDLQRQFDTEDPDFSRSFDDVGRPSTYSFRWAFRIPRRTCTTAIVVAVALGVLMLLARDPGAALLFAALATMFSMIRPSRDGSAGREP